MKSIRSRMGRAASAMAVVVLGAACGKGAPPAPAAAATVAPATTIDWSKNATEFRGRNGQTITVSCPPNGVAGSVWGTDLYSDDSSICTAALHSGRVTLAAGGAVSIVIAPGAPSYVPSIRNGVTTRPWGQWTGSFTIVGGAAPGLVLTPVGAPTPPPTAVPSGAPRAVDWTTNGASLVQAGQSAIVGCPPGGTAGTIWGTDVYTSDSPVCAAGVHMGLITTATGGVIRVTGVPGLPAYPGTARNGVTSSTWPAYPSAFTVTPATAGP